MCYALVLFFMDEVVMLLLLSTPLYPQTLLLPVFLNKTLVSPPISPVFITIDLSLSVVCSLTYLSYSSPVGRNATTILLHRVLSCPLLRAAHCPMRAPPLLAPSLPSTAVLSLVILASFFPVAYVLGQLWGYCLCSFSGRVLAISIVCV